MLEMRNEITVAKETAQQTSLIGPLQQAQRGENIS